MAKETGISSIEHLSGALRVRGVHEGVPTDITVPTAHVDEVRKTEGEKGVRAYLERNLDLGRIDKRYDPRTGDERA